MSVNKTFHLSGVVPILATPFHPDERIDSRSIQQLIQFMADLNVNGATILGVLGEANRLTDAERSDVIRTAVSASRGRLPIIVGTSHEGTYACEELSRMAADLGADAVMVAPCAGPGLTADRIYALYERVALACELPIVVQDHPASTGVQMPTELLLRLIKDIPQVVCIKAESVPTAPKISALKAAMQRPVSILTGLGGLYAFFDLSSGSDGFMTGFAFPEILQHMVKAMQVGNISRVRTLYHRFLPLIVFEQQPGVAIRKEILHRRRLISSATVRHPGCPAAREHITQIDSLINWIMPDCDITKPLII